MPSRFFHFLIAGLFSLCVIALSVLIVPHTFAASDTSGQRSQPVLTSNPPPQATQPTWLIKPHLSNVVVHWTQFTSSFLAGRPDPANGHVVLGDLWVRVDAKGIPDLIHARYTMHGQLYQEFVQKRTDAQSLFGSNYPANTRCQQISQTVSDRFMLSALPDFVIEQGIAAAGFTVTTTAILHPLPPLQQQKLNTALTHIYDASSQPFHPWVLQTPRGSLKTVETMLIDAQHRLVADEVQLLAGKTLLQDHWKTYSAVEVYAPTTVPGSVFQTQMNSQGDCSHA